MFVTHTQLSCRRVTKITVGRPAQDPHRPQRVPPARLARGLHVEPRAARVLVLQVPAAVALLRTHQVERIGEAVVPGMPTPVIQRPQHVVVPVAGEGEACERRADHLPGPVAAVEAVLQEELPAGLGRRRDVRSRLERRKALQNAQRRVQRRVGVLTLAVPAAVRELCVQQPIDGTRHLHPRGLRHPEHHAGDAQVVVAGRPGGEDPVLVEPGVQQSVHGFRGGHPQLLQHLQRVEGRDPLRRVPPGRPGAIGAAMAEHLRPPALVSHEFAGRLPRLVGQVPLHLPADRHIAVQQPLEHLSHGWAVTGSTPCWSPPSVRRRRCPRVPG